MKAVMLNMTVTDQFHMNLVVKVRLILTICCDIATNPFTQEPGLGKDISPLSRNQRCPHLLLVCWENRSTE